MSWAETGVSYFCGEIFDEKVERNPRRDQKVPVLTVVGPGVLFPSRVPFPSSSVSPSPFLYSDPVTYSRSTSPLPAEDFRNPSLSPTPFGSLRWIGRRRSLFWAPTQSYPFRRLTWQNSGFKPRLTEGTRVFVPAPAR